METDNTIASSYTNEPTKPSIPQKEILDALYTERENEISVILVNPEWWKKLIESLGKEVTIIEEWDIYNKRYPAYMGIPVIEDKFIENPPGYRIITKRIIKKFAINE